MVEVLIDPLKLEAYNVTAGELIQTVGANNQLVAAGQVETASGAFSVTVPSTFESTRDIYKLPIKVNGDSVVTLGDLAEIRMTFADREGTARFNGEENLAIQVVKRKGFNAIDTVDQVRARSRPNRQAGTRSCAIPSRSPPRSTSRCRWTRWSSSLKGRS